MSVNNVTFGSTNAYYETKTKQTQKNKKNTPVFDNTKESNTGTKVVIGTALTLATLFLFRGKIKNSKFYQETIKPLVNKAGTQLKNIGNKIKNVWNDTIVPGAKNLFNKVKNWFKGTPEEPVKGLAPTKPKTKKVKKQPKTTSSVSNLNAKDRKLVEDALQDVPTKQQQKAYDESIRYVAPTQAEKRALAENNSKVHQAKREAQSIGNLISDKDRQALEKLKTELPTTPKVETPPTVKPEVKKAQMDQAWAEYNKTPKVETPQGKVKIPTAEEIFAKAEAEAAKVAQEEAEALKAMGF